MSEITVEVVKLNDVTILIGFNGKLDQSNCDAKFEEIYALADEGGTGLNIIFDFEHLLYIDSKSIGYLTQLYDKLDNNNGEMLIAKMRPNIADIFNVVGLTKILRTFDTVEGAEEYLSKKLKVNI